MTLSKNAIGNLLNRYKAVLSKCRILNTFGTLAITGMLVMGGAGIAGAAAQNWSDGKEHTVSSFVDESGVRTSHYVDNDSTLNVTGNLTFLGASGQFVSIHVGENFSVTDTYGSGTLNIGGDVNIGYGTVQVNDGRLTVGGNFTTSAFGGIVVGNGSNSGVATITGDLIFNGGTNYVARGSLTSSDIIINDGVLRSGSTGQESVITAGTITLNTTSASLEAQYGDIRTGTLTVNSGSIEVGSGADDEAHGGKIVVSNAATFGTGSTLSIGNGVFDVSAGTLTINHDAGDVTIFNSGILKMNSISQDAIAKDLKVHAGGTLLMQANNSTVELSVYEASLQQIRDNLFDATTNQGIVAIEGYTITDLTDLNQIGNQVGIFLPNQSLNGGILDGGAGVTIASIAADNTTITGEGTYLTLTGNIGIASVHTAVDIAVTDKGTLNLGSLAYDNKEFIVSGALTADTEGKILVNDATVTASGGITLNDANTSLTLNGGSTLKVQNGLNITDATLLTLDGTRLEVTSGGLNITGTASSRESLVSFDESSTVVTDSLSINNAEVNLERYGSLTVTGADGIQLENSGRLDLNWDAQVVTTGISLDATSGITTSKRNQLNITVTEDFSIDPTTFVYNSTGTSFNAGKITIADNVDLTAQKALNFTAADANNNILTFGSDNTISGTTIDVGTHGVNVQSGSLTSKGNIAGDGGITLSGGHLTLASSSSATLDTPVTITGLSGSSVSNINVENGNWTAEKDISIEASSAILPSSLNLNNNASLTIGAGVNIDTSGGQLIIGSSARLNVGDGSLTSQLKDFGTINLSQADKVIKGGTVAGTVSTTANSTISLVGYTGSDVVLSQEEYTTFLTELTTDLFGAGSQIGSLTVQGITQEAFLALDDIVSAEDSSPNQTVGAGTYTFTSAPTTFLGIVTANGKKDSIIDAVGGTLNLKGGNTALSVGNITINNGTVNLGYDGTNATTGGTLEGSLIATGASSFANTYGNVIIQNSLQLSNDAAFTANGTTTIQGDIIITDGGTSLKPAFTLANADVTAKSFSLNDGGVAKFVEGSLTVEEFNVTNTGAYTGIQVGQQSTDLAVNLPTSAALKVTGDQGITVHGAVSFFAYVGSIEATKMSISDQPSGTSQLIIGFASNKGTEEPVVTLTGADGLTLGAGADLNMQRGTLNTQALNYSSTSEIQVGMNASSTALSFLNFTKDQSFAATDFVNAKTEGKIAVGAGSAGGQVNVDGTLTLNGGGNVAMGDYGILSAKGLTLSADTSLTGGSIHLMAGTGTQKLQGNLTVDNVASNLEVKGGTWTATNNITITSGKLNIEAGTLDATQGLTADAANLSSAKDTSLIVDIASIGSDTLGDVSGSSGTISGSSADTLLGNVTITGFDGTAENPLLLDYGIVYNNLTAAASNAFGTGGSIVLENVRVNTSNATLTQVGDLQDVTLSQNTVQAGDLKTGDVAVVGGVRKNTTSGISDFTNSGGKLTVTGTATDGLMSTTALLAEGEITTTNNGYTELGNASARSSAAHKIITDGLVSASAETKLVNVTASALIEGINGSTTTIAKGRTEAEAGIQIDDSSLIVEGGAELYTSGISGTNISAEIGDSTGAAILISQVTSTTGGYMNYDPPIVAGEGIEKATIAVHGSFGANGIATTHNALQNSAVVFGDTSADWAIQSFNESGLKWGNGTGEVNAALFIRTPQKLDMTTSGTTGAVNVNGNATSGGALAAGTANFAANSLLVVDANGVGTTAALAATNGSLDVDATAKLHIVGGKDKQVVTVVEGFNTGTGIATNGWSNGEVDYENLTNLTLGSSSLAVDGIAWDSTAGDYKVTLKVVFDPAMYAPYMQGPTGDYLNAMTRDAIGLAPNSADYGRRFISRALSEDYGMGLTNAKQTVATIEGAGQLAALGAVGANSLSVGQAVGGALVARNSITGMGSNASKPASVNVNEGKVTAQSSVNGGSGMKNGLGVWLMPLYKWNTVTGSEAGNLENGYESGLGGITFGADYTHGMSEDTALRFGLALNVGAGYSESNGDFNKTNNSFDFWGVSAYAALQKENFVGTLDVGYHALSHQVSSEIPSSMLMGSLESDIQSTIFSAGLNLEYTFATDFMNITPHVGVRYMNVTTQGYDVESAGGLVASTEAESQGVWYFPVSLTLSKDIASDNGWVFTPKLDVGFIAAAGQLDAKSQTTFTGVPGTLELQMQNVDGFAFNGGLGFELSSEEKGVSVGLNYNLQASEHETGHMIFANFRYEF